MLKVRKIQTSFLRTFIYVPELVDLKVRKFLNENMESSHCPKYERKSLENSVLNTQGKSFQTFLFIFWALRQLHIFILKWLYFHKNIFIDLFILFQTTKNLRGYSLFFKHFFAFLCNRFTIIIRIIGIIILVTLFLSKNFDIRIDE